MKSLTIIGIAIVLSGAMAFAVVDIGTAPSRPAYADSDKGTDDCAPTDTTGRCADSCPDGQTQQGTDKDTGVALCVSPPSGCPYAPNLTANDPSCVQPSPQTVTSPATTNDNSVPAQPTFAGK